MGFTRIIGLIVRKDLYKNQTYLTYDTKVRVITKKQIQMNDKKDEVEDNSTACYTPILLHAAFDV